MHQLLRACQGTHYYVCECLLDFSASSIGFADLQGCHKVYSSHVLPCGHFGLIWCQLRIKGHSGGSWAAGSPQFCFLALASICLLCCPRLNWTALGRPKGLEVLCPSIYKENKRNCHKILFFGGLQQCNTKGKDFVCPSVDFKERIWQCVQKSLGCDRS